MKKIFWKKISKWKAFLCWLSKYISITMRCDWCGKKIKTTRPHALCFNFCTQECTAKFFNAKWTMFFDVNKACFGFHTHKLYFVDDSCEEQENEKTAE